LCQKILRSARLYAALLHFDRDLADQTRRTGCPCGGRLHSARYARKPGGGPPVPKALKEREPDHAMQFSFCCEREGCRKRTCPPSTRFLGSRQFLAATVILVSALACGVTGRRRAYLARVYEVSRRTLERWRTWWLEEFAASDLWRTLRARFAPPLDEARLPRTMLERFGTLGTQFGLIACLRALAPAGASDHVWRRALTGPQNTRNDSARGAS
jgi:hypothetical protein